MSPTEKPAPVLISASNAAFIIGVSRRRVAQLVQEGKLTPFMETPLGYLFSVEAVERYAAARKEHGPG